MGQAEGEAMNRWILIFLLLPAYLFADTSVVRYPVHDSWIDVANQGTNYKAADTLCTYMNISFVMNAVFDWDFIGDDSVEINAIVDSAKFSIKQKDATTAKVYLARLCKQFDIDKVDYIDYSGSNWDWGAAGAMNVTSSCGNCYNTGNGTGYDHAKNCDGKYDSANSGGADTWTHIMVDTSHINWMLLNDISRADDDSSCGLILLNGAGGGSKQVWYSMDWTGTANDPYLTIYYHLPSTGPPNAIRSSEGLGMKRSASGYSQLR